MAQYVIENPGTVFLYKTYTCSYSVGGLEHKSLTTSDFGISAISGYRPVGCYAFTSGNSGVSVVKIATSSSSGAEVMQLFRKDSTSSSGTASISYLWAKNEYVQ